MYRFDLINRIAIQNNVRIDISFNGCFQDNNVRIIITDMTKNLKLSMNYDIDALKPEYMFDTLCDMMKTFNEEREKRKYELVWIK